MGLDERFEACQPLFNTRDAFGDLAAIGAYLADSRVHVRATSLPISRRTSALESPVCSWTSRNCTLIVVNPTTSTPSIAANTAIWTQSAQASGSRERPD